jgi:hypothetical protein
MVNTFNRSQEAKDFEPYKTLSELAKITGVTDETLRWATKKSTHQLPYIRAGAQGGRKMARLSVLKKWLQEEEELSVKKG